MTAVTVVTVVTAVQLILRKLEGNKYDFNLKFFFRVFVRPKSILWGHWYPLFRTSADFAHEFQSQGRSSVTCAVLSLELNDPQSHL